MAGPSLRQFVCTGIALVLAFSLSSCDEKIQPALKVSVGQTFPELALVDVQGQSVSTRQYQGKSLVLNVWATWCAPCRKELPSLQNLQEHLAADEVVVLGMSVDADDHLVREFLIDRKIQFTSYMDPTMTVANEVLGIRLYPSTFLIGADGKLREVIEGERQWDTPEMLEHIRQIL